MRASTPHPTGMLARLRATSGRSLRSMHPHGHGGAALWASVLLVTGCAGGGAGEMSPHPQSAVVGRSKAQIVPLVDHHQHLLSPAAADLVNYPPLPLIKLPADLARLLGERTRRWNDTSALAKLYAENALAFDDRVPGWIRGRHAAASSLATLFARVYHITPVAYGVNGSAGYIAGYYSRGDGESVRHFGHVSLALERGGNGTWRIAAETPAFPGPAQQEPLMADELIARLDAAGVRRAVVLSNAYYFDAVDLRGRGALPDEYEKVRAENDWTAQQVAQFPDRLVAFCSVNPLRHYALAELDRCASSGQFMGLKLHFNAAQLNFQDPEQVEKVRRVMGAANRYRLPMIVHVRPGDRYGRDEAEVFLHQLVVAAPDVPIQIAHLWGGESFSGSALAVYADAVAAGLPAARNLYFDISGAWSYGKPEDMAEIRARIRQIGLGRILYASDAPPAEAWEAFRTKLGLADEEIRTIASNVAPYMRSSVEGRH